MSVSDLSETAAPRSGSAQRVRTVVTLGMLVAIAYAVMWVCKPIPKVMGILQFDLKDCVIVIGGLLFGPVAAAASSLVVSLLEMVTATSGTGPIGMLMNFLSTASFCVTASVIYKRRRTQMGAVAGLASGVAVMVAVMLVWNWLITPIYQEVPREVVVSMLPTVFLPFNLVKGGLNMAAALLLYKPVVSALRAAHLAPPSEAPKGKINAGFVLFALFLLVTFVVLMLVLSGLI